MSQPFTQTNRQGELNNDAIRKMMNMLESLLDTSSSSSSSTTGSGGSTTRSMPSTSSQVQVTASTPSSSKGGGGSQDTSQGSQQTKTLELPPEDFVPQGFEQPSPITDNIYLGGVADARNKTRLFALNIEYILNLNEQAVPCFFPSDFIYKTFKFNVQQPFDDLEEIFTFIDLVVNANNRMLIHDEAGSCKSPAILMTYLCQRYNFNLEESYRFLKSKRREIKIPPDLWSLLGDWEVRNIGTSTLAKIVIKSKHKKGQDIDAIADESLLGFFSARQAREIFDGYEHTIIHLQYELRNAKLHLSDLRHKLAKAARAENEPKGVDPQRLIVVQTALDEITTIVGTIDETILHGIPLLEKERMSASTTTSKSTTTKQHQHQHQHSLAKEIPLPLPPNSTGSLSSDGLLSITLGTASTGKQQQQQQQQPITICIICGGASCLCDRSEFTRLFAPSIYSLSPSSSIAEGVLASGGDLDDSMNIILNTTTLEHILTELTWMTRLNGSRHQEPVPQTVRQLQDILQQLEEQTQQTITPGNSIPLAPIPRSRSSSGGSATANTTTTTTTTTESSTGILLSPLLPKTIAQDFPTLHPSFSKLVKGLTTFIRHYQHQQRYLSLIQTRYCHLIRLYLSTRVLYDNLQQQVHSASSDREKELETVINEQKQTIVEVSQAKLQLEEQIETTREDLSTALQEKEQVIVSLEGQVSLLSTQIQQLEEKTRAIEDKPPEERVKLVTSDEQVQLRLDVIETAQSILSSQRIWLGMQLGLSPNPHVTTYIQSVDGKTNPDHTYLIVREVSPASVSHSSGIRVNDYLLAFNGIWVNNVKHLHDVASKTVPGDNISICVLRPVDGQQSTTSEVIPLILAMPTRSRALDQDQLILLKRVIMGELEPTPELLEDFERFRTMDAPPLSSQPITSTSSTVD